MTAESGAIVAVRMPQVNVNDEEVTILNWRVADGGRAVEGEPLCEIETSKAVGELPSPASGVLRQAARAGDTVRIDGVIAYVGPSAEVVDSYLSMLRHDAPPTAAGAAPGAEVSAGAVELARKTGVDLSKVPATEGRVRRADVERYLAERSSSAEPPHQGGRAFAVADDVLPPPLQSAVEEIDALSNHDWAITQHLKETQTRLVVGHAMMDVNMTSAVEWIESQKQAGLMASVLPVLVKAASSALAACPKLQCFRMGRRVFKYRSPDVAFTARSHQGWLYTPVLRRVDAMSLTDMAVRCGELAMAAYRGQLAESDLSGGCMTVSLLNDQPVRLHVGLQNNFQTALLTCGAIRQEVQLAEGRPVAVPTITLTLSYDHGLLDGWDAATALDAARRAVENWTL